MQNIQVTFKTRAFSICMTVPLNDNMNQVEPFCLLSKICYNYWEREIDNILLKDTLDCVELFLTRNFLKLLEMSIQVDLDEPL